MGGGATRQAGVALGERVKAGWEYAAVLGQVEVYGWSRLDARCDADASQEASRAGPDSESAL